MTTTNNIPAKLQQWMQQPGARLLPGELEFLEQVRRFAAMGVGYGFMQQIIEWEWQDDCARAGFPGGAWGPESHELEMRQLEKELSEALELLYGGNT